MCYYLHNSTTKPVPNSGLGWKIFSTGSAKREYKHVNYKVVDSGKREGFCFFRNLETAMFEGLRKMIVRQIKYIGGLSRYRLLGPFVSYPKTKKSSNKE